jgi:hypothetical protein
MRKKTSILFIIFAIFISQSPALFAQRENTPKNKKSSRSKKDKGSKELDKYFYGNKKKRKGSKDKNEDNERRKKGKGKKGSGEGIVDTKSILKANGGGSKNTTSGGNSENNNSGATYRPIYIGNKLVTGEITEVQGFRICVYNGNNRTEALAQKVQFMKKHPGIRSYLGYNTPYYKIKVGDYIDKKVAQNALKSFIKNFPSAFIIPDVVTSKNIMIYKNY